MNVQETIDYLKAMKQKAEKDSDPRAAKCVDAMESALNLIDDREKLQNRCFTFAAGNFCIFCPMECKNNMRGKI